MLLYAGGLKAQSHITIEEFRRLKQHNEPQHEHNEFS